MWADAGAVDGTRAGRAADPTPDRVGPTVVASAATEDSVV